jgi:hypothetical protein
MRVYACVTGTPPPIELTWETEAEAQAVLDAAGGLDALVTAKLGEPVPWGACGLGDLVTADIRGSVTLCVHDGAQLVAPAGVGLARVPWEFALHGWRLS